jgi:hypothetical protein
LVDATVDVQNSVAAVVAVASSSELVVESFWGLIHLLQMSICKTQLQ